MIQNSSLKNTKEEETSRTENEEIKEKTIKNIFNSQRENGTCGRLDFTYSS